MIIRYMIDKIQETLERLFNKHRIVFWYDTKRELRDMFEQVDLNKTIKLEITNNEFGIKHRILRGEPKKNFLLYKEGPRPDRLENWLLDVELAQGEFRADKHAMWLTELELGYEFSELPDEHSDFFQSKQRREQLKRLLTGKETKSAVRGKMLAVCTGAQDALDTILEELLGEFAHGETAKYELLERCNLTAFLWEKVEKELGYRCKEPSVKDFALTLFKTCYFQSFAGSWGAEGECLAPDALVFLKRWKDSRRWQEAFETLSQLSVDILNVEADLNVRPLGALVELDYFELIDQRLVSELVKAVTQRTIAAGQVSSVVRQRKTSHWYERYTSLYQAIDAAAQALQLVDTLDVSSATLKDGVDKYVSTWYRLDQLYRTYVFHAQQAKQSTLLKELSELVENHYVNNYLLKQGNSWQQCIESSNSWELARDPRAQRNFFKRHVRPYLNKDKKLFVIISDAFRYEIGEEFMRLLRQKDKYEVTLDPMIATLPSFTQLGMAALLPHESLTLQPDGSVLVDGKTSQGLNARKKQLQRALGDKSVTAIGADEIIGMSGDDRRAFVREHDLVYVYHNEIDMIGDKRDSEGNVFQAVQRTLESLESVVRCLVSANVNNLLLTADHGFLFQNRSLEESDFSTVDLDASVEARNRRYVLGVQLPTHERLNHFTAEDLGLEAGVEVQIPKSINRLRVKGAGSRYVHGGATLQELVIPVLKVNKKRKSDTSVVPVEILKGSTTIISTGVFKVVFYQKEAVTDKVHAQTLRAGIYDRNGEAISDEQDLMFDIRSEDPRDREVKADFVLSRKADSANGQEVTLALKAKASANHFVTVNSVQYTLRRSFTSDFDF